MVLGWEEVEHATVGEGGAVLDGLYPGYGPLSIQEYVCLVPQAQLISLHDLGVPTQCHPEGSHQSTWAAHADPSLTPGHPDKRGRTFCGSLVGNTKTKGVGGTEERFGSWLTRGVFSEQKSPQDAILNKIKHLSGASAAR